MTRGRNQKMPFLQDAERAAQLMLRAIEARRRTTLSRGNSPGIARVGRWLPAALYDRLLARATLRE
jgi:hypothetical protein